MNSYKKSSCILADITSGVPSCSHQQVNGESQRWGDSGNQSTDGGNKGLGQHRERVNGQSYKPQ